MNKKYLGIELGSTRIKAVLTDGGFECIAEGSHTWENTLENGYWTYPLSAVESGVREAYAALAQDYNQKTGETLRELDGLGVSAMMHGYLPFDKDDNLLAPFRTWRNTTTGAAAEKLSALFNFNIPQRWSVAHLYQAIFNNEPHVKDIAFLTTLAGYAHYKLTGEKTLGVGDASGMFPITGGAYDGEMRQKFLDLTGFDVNKIFPRIKTAGENAGVLTADGALFLDPTGNLTPGAPCCPPEGDAGTGMAATNSVTPRTGNVSAGTSVFAMIVLEKPLNKAYPEIDIVTTPDGAPVAMVHCNSCTSDIDAWINLIGEGARALGARFDKNLLYETLYKKALDGAADGGGLVNYNFFSGEPVAGIDDGCPLFFRKPDARMNLADFMRTQLYSAAASLKLGMTLLKDEENVAVDCILGHGGFFKVKGAGQRVMADALGVPVAVMESAGEGGAWGIALLAAYAAQNGGKNEPLAEFLKNRVFADKNSAVITPDADGAKGFSAFMERYKKGLPAVKAAADSIML